MIPAEVIERARETAVERWYGSQDHVGQADTNPEPYTKEAADAALRSLLTDLLEESQLGGHTDTALPGWESAQPVIDALLRELSDE